MRQPGSGFSLIELVVAIAIVGVLLALGAPNYSSWIKSSQIRTAAESIQNGLQLARGEAVRRNSQIRFQLTSTTGSDCVLSTTVTNWIVSYDDPASACDTAMLNEAFPVTDATNNPSPRMIQVRPATEGSSDVVAAAGQSTIIFNGLGRVTNAATNPVIIDLSNPSGGDCSKVRCLRVTVSTGGQVRMCDPRLTTTNPTDPQSCPA